MSKVLNSSACQGRLNEAAHTNSSARAQAASLTDYFVRIGRIDPEERLDGRWPVRGELYGGPGPR